MAAGTKALRRGLDQVAKRHRLVGAEIVYDAVGPLRR